MSCNFSSEKSYSPNKLRCRHDNGDEQGERILRTLQGIDLSDSSMVLDLIHETGPGGEYMTKKFSPDLFDIAQENFAG